MEFVGHSSQWIPVEDYVADPPLHPSELVSMILDGDLIGERRGDRWYLAVPLVMILSPESACGTAVLSIAACRIGHYVTAGRGEIRIPLRVDDPVLPVTLAALNEAMMKAPDLPVEIHLNGEYFLVDSSLWVDLRAALIEIQTPMDHVIEGSP
jgi:hypothetical protein